MSILYHVKDGKVIAQDSIKSAIRRSLEHLGFAIEEPKNSEREDFTEVSKIFGVMNYGGVPYDILFKGKQKILSPPAKTFFDQFGIAEISGNLRFTESREIVPGMIPPIAELYFEPTQRSLKLLRNAALNFKREQQGLDLVVLGYLPNRKEKFVFEQI